MTNQLALSIFIEGLLILLTILFLTQPRPFFRVESERSRNLLTVSGYFLLSVTFCWSVIFGCVLTLHHLTFRI